MIDIITLNYNSLKYTKMFVQTLFKNTSDPFRLIIVDNASTEPGTTEFLAKLEQKHPNVFVHRNEVPDSGFAEGNNTGLQYCDSEFVALINNDILIPANKKWLNQLLRHFEDPEVGLVTCKLLYPNDTIQFAGGFLVKNAFSTLNCFYHRGRFEDAQKYSQAEQVPQATFAMVIARRKEFGTLDTSYKMGTFEDNDKCMEYLKKGKKIIYDGTVYLYHYESRTTLSRPDFVNQSARNSDLFRKRWLPFIWNSVTQNPAFWGWTREDLVREIQICFSQDIYWTSEIRLHIHDWIKIIDEVK